MSERQDSQSPRGGADGVVRPDEETVRRWIDLEADGALAAEEARRLESALAADPRLARERQAALELRQQLEACRIAVRPGFREAVMERLPSAAWEPTGRRGRGLAISLAVALAAAATLSLALGSAATGSLAGLLGAVGEALVASLVTGAGLLGASWRGVGLALEELLSASPSTVVVLALLVVLLNGLFWRLLLRGRDRTASAAESTPARRPDTESR